MRFPCSNINMCSLLASGAAEQFQHNLLAEVVVCFFLSEGPCCTCLCSPSWVCVRGCQLPAGQYENCRIVSPEGVGLATCGLKKVRWYLDRDLAELVSQDPPVIRLKFTPKGRCG